MKHVFLALGSNIGDRKAYILKAIEFLKEKISDIVIAPIYETKAFGVTDQNNFYNTALTGKTEFAPPELLTFAKDIEKRVGRIERFRWGPREIDIDILFYNDEVLKSEKLTIPHPGIPERYFVLKPLSDVAPDFIHPTLKKSVSTLLSELPEEKVISIQNEKSSP